MNGISYNGNAFEIVLRQTAGTGFEWLTVYHTDNVITGDSSFYVETNGEPITGGSGDFTLRGSVTDDEDAVLILKYARPWEGEGDYCTFMFTMENGAIKEVRRTDTGLYTDCKAVHISGEKVFVRSFLPKDWAYETYENEQETGFLIRPEGEQDSVRLYYTDTLAAEISSGKTITIRGKEFILATNANDPAVFGLYGPDHLCMSGTASWWQEHFLDLIRILDNSAYEADES